MDVAHGGNSKGSRPSQESKYFYYSRIRDPNPDLWTTAEDELYFHGSLWEDGVQSVTAKTTLEANFKYLQVVAGTEDRVRRPTTKKENTLPHTYYTLPEEYSGLLLTYK